jgi:hypothetical protein
MKIYHFLLSAILCVSLTACKTSKQAITTFDGFHQSLLRCTATTVSKIIIPNSLEYLPPMGVYGPDSSHPNHAVHSTSFDTVTITSTSVVGGNISDTVTFKNADFESQQRERVAKTRPDSTFDFIIISVCLLLFLIMVVIAFRLTKM